MTGRVETFAVPNTEADEGWATFAGGGKLRMATEHVFLDGLSVPTVIEVVLPPAAEWDDPTTALRIEVHDGRPELVEIRLTSTAERPGITQSSLRNLDVATVLDIVVGAVSSQLRVDENGFPLGTGFALSAEDAFDAITRGLSAMTSSGTGPRAITPELLARVAAIYRENIHGKPTKAVQEAFRVGPRAAAGYVQRARAEGHLPRTTQGRKQA